MLALHAPDGLFRLPVILLFAGVVVLVLAAAVLRLSRGGDHRLVPVMGVLAAFVFAGQMVNFPIAAGTTGHLLGGTLAAILLGPWAGTLVMAAVVFFQALLGDGGITALGPNLFNMGVIGTCGGYACYRAALRTRRASRRSDRAARAGAAEEALAGGSRSDGGAPAPAQIVAAGFFAAWLAVVLASVSVSLQLAASGTATLARTLPAMVGTHVLIGIGEALITALVLAFLLKTRPELLGAATGQPANTTEAAAALGWPAALLGLAAALLVGGGLSLLPALWDHPDGLEFVGQREGFLYEEPRRDEHGALVYLPAYPLGARLEVVAGHVTVVHCYPAAATPLQNGDVLGQIGTQAVTSLAGAAAALALDPQTDRFTLEPGTPVEVSVLRAGQTHTLRFPAAAAPEAGARPPHVALLPDYTVPGLRGLWGTSVAGLIGTVVMFFLSIAVGRALMRPSRLAQACTRSPSS